MQRILKKKIASVLPKSKGLWLDITNSTKELKIKKGEQLIQYRDLCKSVYVLVDGALECKLHKNRSNSQTVWFYFDERFDVIVNFDSYYKNQPTKYSVTAIEDSVVFEFKKEEVEAWRRKYEQFNEFYKNDMLRAFMDYHEIRNYMLVMSSEEYLEYLEKNYAFITNRLSSQKLAHFMGITPEWLSKVKQRRNNSKKSAAPMLKMAN
ncbi:MAG: cyclic nucleotide-binding domain-containing protein [Bacteroidota bacterium]